MKSGRQDIDFVIGLFGGPLLLWILFWCSCVLRAVVIPVAKDQTESVGVRAFHFLFGIVKYGAVPLLLVFGLADKPAMLAGSIIGGIASWIWIRNAGTK